MYTYTLPINPENSTKEHKKFWIRNPGPDGSHEDKFRKHGNKKKRTRLLYCILAGPDENGNNVHSKSSLFFKKEPAKSLSP